MLSDTFTSGRSSFLPTRSLLAPPVRPCPLLCIEVVSLGTGCSRADSRARREQEEAATLSAGRRPCPRFSSSLHSWTDLGSRRKTRFSCCWRDKYMSSSDVHDDTDQIDVSECSENVSPSLSSPSRAACRRAPAGVSRLRASLQCGTEGAA